MGLFQQPEGARLYSENGVCQFNTGTAGENDCRNKGYLHYFGWCGGQRFRTAPLTTLRIFLRRGILGQGLSFFEPQDAPPRVRVERDQRIRLNQRSDRNAERSTRTAAAAEKSAVISVWVFSNTSRAFRLW